MVSRGIRVMFPVTLGGGARGWMQQIMPQCVGRRAMSTIVPSIAHIMKTSEAGDDVELRGWVRSVRKMKKFSFVELTDGSSNDVVQAVLDRNCSFTDDAQADLTTGSSVTIKGSLSSSPSKAKGKFALELQASNVKVIGKCDSSYPLQKKKHSPEFIREECMHLRARTRTFSSVMRVRDVCATAIDDYMHQESLIKVHTPIITNSDCEGAGEAFSVVAEDSKLFFDVPAYLTVSGQLHAEMFACAMGRVYTFGPTFRAEKSDTRMHLAEFWMVEPEVAFAEMSDMMELTENLTKHTIAKVLDRCEGELMTLAADKEESDKRLACFAKTAYEVAMCVPFSQHQWQ